MKERPRRGMARLCVLLGLASVARASVQKTTISLQAESACGGELKAEAFYKMDADVSHPLVVFAHGQGVTPDTYSALLTYLASYDFVVLAPTPEKAGGGWCEHFNQDVQAVVTWAHANRKNSSLPVLTAVDWSASIGLMGHSMGGLAALYAATWSSPVPIGSVAVFSPKSDGFGRPSLSMPVWFCAGQNDTVAKPWEVEWLYGLTQDGVARWYTELAGQTHVSYLGNGWLYGYIASFLDCQLRPKTSQLCGAFYGSGMHVCNDNHLAMSSCKHANTNTHQ